MNAATDEYQPPATTRALLITWVRRALASKVAHYEMTNRLGKRGHWLGGR